MTRTVKREITEQRKKTIPYFDYSLVCNSYMPCMFRAGNVIQHQCIQFHEDHRTEKQYILFEETDNFLSGWFFCDVVYLPLY